MSCLSPTGRAAASRARPASVVALPALAVLALVAPQAAQARSGAESLTHVAGFPVLAVPDGRPARGLKVYGPKDGVSVAGEIDWVVVPPAGTERVSLYLDGKLRRHDSSRPWIFTIDADNVRGGRHELEFRARRRDGELLSKSRTVRSHRVGKPRRKRRRAKAPLATVQAPFAAPSPVIAAAGDIACEAGEAATAAACKHGAVSDLLTGGGLTQVLALGDLQYATGLLTQFQRSYEPTWGRVKSITRPVPGNHEYSSGADGYFDYFNGVGAADGIAGPRGLGYYSYDLGSWHVVALNSNIARDAGSAQLSWLKGDLAANPRQCTLAYWHHPRYSSGEHGDDASQEPFWEALSAAGADVVLNGHDHNYERFAPQRGIREFVVGTGGKSLRTFPTTRPGSEVRSIGAMGVLNMTLNGGSYDWRFVPVAGQTFTDTGTQACS